MKEQIAAGRLADSQGSWSELLDFIDSKSASVVSVVSLTLVLLISFVDG